MVREVRALSSLSSHPNVVRFAGACLGPLLVLREHYPGGSLRQLLGDARAAAAAGPEGDAEVGCGGGALLRPGVPRARAWTHSGMNVHALCTHVQHSDCTHSAHSTHSTHSMHSTHTRNAPSPPGQVLACVTWERRLEMLLDVAVAMT
jgi:hypothetical protein